MRHFRYKYSNGVLTLCPCQDSDDLPALCAGVVVFAPPPTVALGELTRSTMAEMLSTHPVLQAEIEVCGSLHGGPAIRADG